MGNSNYRKGRSFEYETIKAYEEKGYIASRTAGSHGPFDVVAFRLDRVPEFIQCKCVSSITTTKRLLATFKAETAPSQFYHQVMLVKVKGTKYPLSITV